MATLVFKTGTFIVGATNLTTSVKGITINYSSEVLDETAMGDDTRIHKGGLLDWSIDVDFNQEFGAALVDATLFPLVGVTSCIEVRSQSAAASATNPSFSGIGILSDYPPIGGGVGSLLQAKGSWKAASTLTRAVV